ncbi:molybdopterin molybdotransferase MoeA [Limoniibacter endophyticus]|uniref:Molybdopterin molybdenumtransferase n=1 Tax=Limoniibacter endophyticus TaxID=1565040 RepID=A0A8J3DL99_9HYPH|nr:gephyrin-like molybdotransferase Glp [Limoniibacter endophyticus]GHC60898.1 molybdopterin molybdenumtransferase MoeA [Limoniibacter endophyticus]
MALLPLAEALARVLDSVETTSVEHLPLHLCDERVLAEDLSALRTQPPFDSSAMDGYAVRAEDVFVIGEALRVIGAAPAGTVFNGVVSAGECVRIFTGAPVPAGADSILIQENATRVDDATIKATAPVTRGQHIRQAGLDFRQGDIVLRKGRLLDPAALSLAAACNHAVLPVHRKPRVALLSTGDELRAPGDSLQPGQIIASNAYGVAAIARQAGAEVIDLGIVRDDMPALNAAIAMALRRCDVLITLGGASVGDHDLVRTALAECGVAMNFWKIAMRPGKPTMYGRNDKGVHVLGLPGNPVASFVGAHLFLVPLIAGMTGQEPRARLETAILAAELRENDQRQDYLRATLHEENGRLVAKPFPVQDSSMLSTLAVANCLIVRPPFAPAAIAGDTCRVLRLRN